MPIGSRIENIIFNLDSLQDNQILVYDASTGSFKNETAAASANANITGQGRNVGNSGVGIYKQNDSQYLEFYKLQAGSNATITLADNVLTIDARVGTGTISLGSANANTIVVADSNGNVFNGSDSLTFDGTTFSFLGAGNNVTVANGLVTSNNLVTTNLTFAGITMPTADGTANQVLVTDGANTISFANQQDISGKTDNTTFNAHVATAMLTTTSNAPALNNTYDLGNSTNKYNEVFSTYFRGTADVAVNATNLGSVPASSYRLVADSYTKAEVDSAISSGGGTQDLTISGNVISLTNQTGNVDLTSTLASVAGNYGDSNVDAHLNQSGPTSGHVLSWNGSDYAWVANSGETGAQGPAGPSVTIQDEGVSLSTDASIINFVGAGVTASGTGGTKTITISGGGSGSGNVVDDTSPQLGGALDVNGHDITSTSNGDIELDPNGSGVVVFKGNATKGSGQFKLNCENNSHGIILKGPAHSAGANYTLTFPTTDGTADQVLKTDGSGGLSWTTQSSSSTSFEYFKLYYTSAGAIDTAQGSGGYSDKSTNIGNVTINNAASNSCEVIVDFGGNYNFPPIGITAYGFSQSTSEYVIKGQSASTNNTTLKLAGSGSPHGSLGTSNVTLSLTRSETGSSSGFGQTTHAWIYFSMGS